MTAASPSVLVRSYQRRRPQKPAAVREMLDRLREEIRVDQAVTECMRDFPERVWEEWRAQ